ncbi:ABC transporter substrate-binding protein [Muricoccus radiodurans]|uniref:ABC transporter substrate-binding protein n=1 Tax=Muricoccus radiodurans TaxID=2231721 RepID=UPI003CF13114
MYRRRFIATSAGLAAVAGAVPARAQRRDPRVLVFVPQANLTALDPIWTTASISQTHGYTVFDTLFGVDDAGRVQPQMAEGHSVSDDGRTWTIRLRDGLRWHDGERVLARDCAASLERWAKRDVFGGSLLPLVESWGAPDDRTIRIALRSPFPLLPNAMAKTAAVSAFMMPERLARTDPFRQVTEMVGSGPYRFVADEYNSGSRVVYRKFEGYVPRQEPAQNTAGGKVAHFERIEWLVMPDSATAAAALRAGEVDWWDQVNPDLTPLLRRTRGVTVGVNDPSGYIGSLRFNTLHPPFNNVGVRRAILYAANQDDYLRAITGNDPEIFSECHSMWPCGTAYGQETRPADLRGPPDLNRAKAMLRDAGYRGEKVVIINPSDLPSIGPFGLVTADLLRKLEMNVELVETDWGSVIQRRASREPVERGGWSIFHTWWPSPSILNPAISPILRGQGANGWFGWYSNPRVETLAAEWLTAQDEASQARLAEEIQQESYREVPVVPLGRYFIRTAWRTGLTGFLKTASSYPWNVRWA